MHGMMVWYISASGLRMKICLLSLPNKKFPDMHLILLVLREISNPCKAWIVVESAPFFLIFLVMSVDSRILKRYSFGGCCRVLRVLSLTNCHFFFSELPMTTCRLSSGRSMASCKVSIYKKKHIQKNW